MNDISIIYSANELRTDSRDLASLLDHRHRTIFESITKYSTELSELGILPFETERLKTDHLGEREHKFVMLNEDQCYFVLTLMRNNAHVVKSKLKLVKAFRDARSQLAMRDIARVEARECVGILDAPRTGRVVIAHQIGSSVPVEIVRHDVEGGRVCRQGQQAGRRDCQCAFH